MAENTLRVVARLKAKPDKNQELRTLLLDLIAPTHQEEGCISYELLENKEDPSEFTFVEEWVDDAALDAHFQTDHIGEALQKLPDLLAAELDVRRFVKIG